MLLLVARRNTDLCSHSSINCCLQSQAESQGETGPTAEAASASPAAADGAAGSRAGSRAATPSAAGAQDAGAAGQAALEQAAAEAAAAAPPAQRADSLDVGTVQQAWEAAQQMGVEYTAPGGQQVSEQYAAVEGQYPGGQVRWAGIGLCGRGGLRCAARLQMMLLA